MALTDNVGSSSQAEHEPMILAQFPERTGQVEYFEIGDLDVEASTDAIANLIYNLDQLLHQL